MNPVCQFVPQQTTVHQIFLKIRTHSAKQKSEADRKMHDLDLLHLDDATLFEQNRKKAVLQVTTADSSIKSSYFRLVRCICFLPFWKNGLFRLQ